ncbi:MAG TPA: TonB-dependent receptor [Terriglobales bacterium]|nr:TonB-dependent receptor [Terriglobales bacterium]
MHFSDRRFASLALVLLLSTFSSIVCRGQVAGGTVSGVVSDASGARVPRTQVSIQNRATGVTRVVTANDEGFYNAPNLLPGEYEVTASAAGFQTRTTVLALTVGQDLVLNVAMQVGMATQSVEIKDTAPIVELGSSTLTDVVGAAAVRDLPLNGRSWTDLALLQPGVAAVETQIPFTGGAGRGNRGFGAQMSISGARPQQNNYRLDGISINDYANGGPGSVLGINLGVDAVQEFSVSSSNTSAEYGKTSGGVVNATTRSGTNLFHGDAYEFLRNSALDTRNYFDGARIPPFKRNQFGAAAGGPIIKDRTFIFGDYEGIRQSLGTTNDIVVPTDTAWQGFVCTVNSSGQKTCPTTPIAVSPGSLKYRGLYPSPNGVISPDGNSGHFLFASQQVVNEDYFTVRADHKISTKDSIFSTYMFDNAPFTQPDSFNNVLQGSKTRRQALILEESHIFSPTLLNTFRLGGNRQAVDNNQSVAAINSLANDTSLAAMPGRTAAGINIPGFDRMVGGVGASPTYFFHFTTYQAYDDAFLTRGLHSFKLGAVFERFQDNVLALSNPNGLFNFGSLTAFLTNSPKKFQAGFADTLTPRNLRQNLFGVYFQDDWRWRPNLTLNLGLRYEMTSVPTEKHGKLTVLRQITDATPHLGDPYFSNPTLRNFEPRVGFAWDPFSNGKSSVRGGFGIYDVLPLLYQFQILDALSAPFFEIGATTSCAKLPPAPATASCAAVGPGGNAQFLTGNPATFGQAYIEANPPRNYVMQWNLNIQRQLANNLSLTVGYVGSRGIHQPFRSEDADMVLPTLTPQGYLWPSPAGSGTKLNPNAGTIRALMWRSDSYYDALEVGVKKIMSHGFQAQSSFTWGKSIDTSSATNAGDAYGNSVPSLHWFDPRLSRGPSDFNIGKVFVLNGIWSVPGVTASGPFAWAAKGWQLSSVFKLSDGVPFTPLIGGDPLGLNSTDPWDFPNRVPGCSLVNGNYKQQRLDYVNLSCFKFPNPATLRGNAGRNSIVGPGLEALDFSVFKNNYIPRISESFNVQFRAEFFNILNHANFGPPNTTNQTFFDATGNLTGAAGVLSAPTVTSSRQLQFAVKLIW